MQVECGREDTCTRSLPNCLQKVLIEPRFGPNFGEPWPMCAVVLPTFANTWAAPWPAVCGHHRRRIAGQASATWPDLAEIGPIRPVAGRILLKIGPNPIGFSPDSAELGQHRSKAGQTLADSGPNLAGRHVPQSDQCWPESTKTVEDALHFALRIFYVRGAGPVSSSMLSESMGLCSCAQHILSALLMPSLGVSRGGIPSRLAAATDLVQEVLPCLFISLGLAVLDWWKPLMGRGGHQGPLAGKIS